MLALLLACQVCQNKRSQTQHKQQTFTFHSFEDGKIKTRRWKFWAYLLPVASILSLGGLFSQCIYMKSSHIYAHPWFPCVCSHFPCEDTNNSDLWPGITLRFKPSSQRQTHSEELGLGYQ